ncbi:hypothetical protein [Cytobacillus firmus]|uniref:hypothetical protein n=1 Tax=Cytobacillus firmus TaxID=1399 RepID=UPI0018CCDD5C|nr:hypothetical protein [Cytobacillus firmus]MBG9587275.1 hypothetical protein [Cytobacillus firmus]
MYKIFKVLLSSILISILFFNVLGTKQTQAATVQDSKMVFLYVGKYSSSSYYPTYTSSDISKFNVNEFVIVPGKEQYSGLVNDINSLVQNIVASKGTSSKIWIGTQLESPTAYDSYTQTDYNNYLSYVNSLQSTLGSNWSYVEGIYMTNEAITNRSIAFDQFQYDSQILFYEWFSDEIHNTYNKDFLWVPYYGYGSSTVDIIRSVGYVANKTNIFDLILLQPHYYFDSTVKSNLNAVYQSTIKQAVTWRDGVIVGGSKDAIANAKIGVQMELDHNARWGNDGGAWIERYNEYVDTFKGLRGNYPISYYAGSRNDACAMSDDINRFFSYGGYFTQ